MSLEDYARFLEAQGLRVFEAEDSLWVEKRKFFFENIPPHRRLHLSAAAVRRMFRKGAAVVRYACPDAEGQPSFEYVCSEKSFGLELLAPDARRRVRRGMETCEVRPVDFDLLAKHGCAINRDTLARQNRAGSNQVTHEEPWRRFMRACARIPAAEAFGAFVGERFVGFSISVLVDNYSYLHYTQAYSKDLKFSPINMLTYVVTKTMLARPSISCVSQGLEPFLPMPDLEHFKLAMGFRKRPLRRCVAVNPFFRPAFSRPAVWLARIGLERLAPSMAEDLVTFAHSMQERNSVPRGHAANVGLGEL